MSETLAFLKENWVLLSGVLLSGVAAVFGIIKFFNEREEAFKKEFWQKRYENYERVLELASKITVSQN